MSQSKQQQIDKFRASSGISAGIENDIVAILNYLPYCEWELISFMKDQKVWQGPPPTTPPDGFTPGSGSVDFGLFSYWLTNPDLIQNTNLRTRILEIEIAIETALIIYNYINGTDYTLNSLLKLQMTSANYNVIVNSSPALVYYDGSILSTETWATYDQQWFGAFYNMMQTALNKLYYNGHNFPLSVPPVPINLKGQQQNTVTIAMIGDWGSGDTAAQQVMQQITALNPDYIIHLGDVYYSGSPSSADAVSSNYSNPNEELNNFINLWPPAYNGRSYTINSNHEMYTGGNGLFIDALKARANPPGTGSLFVDQKGMGCFALNYGGWTLLGLDSAFNSDIIYAFMYGRLDAPAPARPVQTPWIQNLGLTASKTIVLTHHTGFAFDCSCSYDLWNEVNNALGGDPYAWYWGHVHNGIVYTSPVNIPVSAIQPNVFNTNTYARCLGHAGLPYGPASTLNGNSNVEWQEGGATPAPGPMPNGFVLLTMTTDAAGNMSAITEAFYDIGTQPQPVFSKVIYG